MTISYAATNANAQLDQFETSAGVSVKARGYNGTMPADADAALAGNTLIAEGTLPSDWMAAAAAKVKSKTGTWTLTGLAAAGAGTAITFLRIYDNVGTACHLQGTAGVKTTIATSALTAANGNVLNFAATAGVAVGQKVTGTGVVVGATVIAFTGTTVTLSHSSTAGVASAASIIFTYDAELDNNSIANAQSVTVSTFSITKGN